MKKPVDVEKNKENYLQFIANRKNLILSLIDDEGKPLSAMLLLLSMKANFIFTLVRSPSITDIWKITSL